MPDVDYSILLGEEKGFKQVFETNYPGLLRFARAYVNDEQDAEDILQNVFLTLWEKRASMRADTNMNAYLLTVVKNHCMDFLKHRQVMERYSINQQTAQQLETSFNYYAVSKLEPEQMDIESLERLAEKAINDLPEQCRRVFELSRYEGLKYREIAEKLGVSIKTVETHISHALKILRITLKDSFLLWIGLGLMK